MSNLNGSIFHQSFIKCLDQHRIKGNVLAELSGRTPDNISRIRNSKTSPKLADFAELIEICENYSPGFQADFIANLSEDLGVVPENDDNNARLSHVTVILCQSAIISSSQDNVISCLGCDKLLENLTSDGLADLLEAVVSRLKGSK